MHSPENEGRSRRIRMPKRWWSRLLLGGLVLTALFAPAAWANHQFSDVPTASPHHTDISAIASVGITGGCAPGLYCPSQAVTRDQMASFIRRGLSRTTSSGTTAGVNLTNSFASVATATLTAGGTGSGSGFVLLMGSFTADQPSGNTGADHRVEYRLREVNTGFTSNVSSMTLKKMNSLATDARPTISGFKQWSFTIPVGATRTYSLDARVAFPSPITATTEANSRLMTVLYVPFGPSGTSSPLGSPGSSEAPVQGSGGRDVR